MDATRYAGTQAFYNEGSIGRKRERSPEYDYGVWWRDSLGAQWRVSWVAETGEIYALRLGHAQSLSRDDGPLMLLGVVPPSSGPCLHDCIERVGEHWSKCAAAPNYEIESVLEGWADECGAADSLRWLIDRVKGRME